MKLQIFFICLSFLKSISCAYYDHGKIELSTETAPSGTLQSGYYYEGTSHWHTVSGSVSLGSVTPVVTFTYDATVPSSTPSATSGINVYTKYLDIINISGGSASRTYKNGPFVIFDIAPQPTCSTTVPTNLVFKIRFFCNDTDANAFYTQMNAVTADVNFWVNSANIAQSVPTAKAVAASTLSITYSDVLLGNVVDCS